jgi:hypothetical protein
MGTLPGRRGQHLSADLRRQPGEPQGTGLRHPRADVRCREEVWGDRRTPHHTRTSACFLRHCNLGSLQGAATKLCKMAIWRVSYSVSRGCRTSCSDDGGGALGLRGPAGLPPNLGFTGQRVAVEAAAGFLPRSTRLSRFLVAMARLHPGLTTPVEPTWPTSRQRTAGVCGRWHGLPAALARPPHFCG